jgi:four helix bundle protein
VGFERLALYRKATDLADELSAAVREWSSFDRWAVGMQLIRAADSVGANLAEAYGRGPFADRRRFVFIARGSAYELQHWIARARARDLPLPPEATMRAAEVGKMLNGLLTGWSTTPRA